jgi:uncharacterized DUF497 family protein
MKITYDPNKRILTLTHRNLDFEHANQIFANLFYTKEDTRKDYGEIRFITVGFLHGNMVVMVWTQRGAARHIISLRRANEKERKIYKILLD